MPNVESRCNQLKLGNPPQRANDVLKAKIKSAKGECLFPMRVGTGHDWSAPMNELEPEHLRAIKKASLTRFRLYDLRHTFGTRAVEAGTDLLSLAKLMGHADLKTTQRYVHLSKRHLSEVQTRIERHRAEREIAEAEAQKGMATIQ